MTQQNYYRAIQKSIQTNSLCSDSSIENDRTQTFKQNFQVFKIKKTALEKKKYRIYPQRPSKFENQPSSPKQWTFQDQDQLIQLHKKFGNKWTLLTRHYPGASQNFLKNHFYSRLRKSVRKLNKFISSFYPKVYDKFKLNIIFKLSNISQGKTSQKDKICPQIFSFYREFLYKLIKFSQNDKIQQKVLQMSTNESIQVQSLILGLVALENLFRLIRGERTAKGKKKNIAYLRQFHFRLGLQSSIQMMISKQKIYLYDSSNLQNSIKAQSSNKNNFFIEEEHINQKFGQLQFISKKTQDYQMQNSLGNRNQRILEVIQLNSENYFSDPKDYYGMQIKQIDIFCQNQNDGGFSQKYNFCSEKFFDFNEQMRYW